jgi:hypothetical protein
MSRVRYHLQGNAEGSTPRRILGILLEEKSGFPLRRVGSGSTTPLPITRLSQVSSLVSAGFTTTVPGNSLPVQRFPLPTLIRLISPRPDQPEEYLQTGKRCSTNRKPKIGLLSGEHAVDLGHHGGSLSYGSCDALS